MKVVGRHLLLLRICIQIEPSNIFYMITSNPPEHYNEDYFLTHYGPLVVDDARRNLLSQYWRFILESHAGHLREDFQKSLLDYGAGSGVVSAGFPNTACFDVSPWSIEFLSRKDRTVYTKLEDIPKHAFSNLLCSHSLEHYESPQTALCDFREFVGADGRLILMLPVERGYKVRLEPDSDQHLYCWNFQTIGNLLRLCGWKPILGEIVFGPFMLNTLGKLVSTRRAVKIAAILGRLRRNFESMLVVAEKIG